MLSECSLIGDCLLRIIVKRNAVPSCLILEERGNFSEILRMLQEAVEEYALLHIGPGINVFYFFFVLDEVHFLRLLRIVVRCGQALFDRNAMKFSAECKKVGKKTNGVRSTSKNNTKPIVGAKIEENQYNITSAM